VQLLGASERCLSASLSDSSHEASRSEVVIPDIRRLSGRLSVCRVGARDASLGGMSQFGLPFQADDGQKAQIPIVASRHDTIRTTCRACRARRHERDAFVMRVVPCLFQHGGRRRSSSARVYKFGLLCSGFTSVSKTSSGKSGVDISTPVHAVATPLNTCRASRACRDELAARRASRNARVAMCCPTSTT